MEQAARWIVRRRILIPILFLLAAAVAGVAALSVETNYEMTKYLAQDMPSQVGLRKVVDEYGVPTSVRAMVEDVSIAEGLEIKKALQEIPYIASVTWLDDATDLYVPVEMMDPALRDPFYRDGAALYFIDFQTTDYDTRTGEAVDAIRQMIGDKGYIYGTASSSQEVRRSTEQSVGALIVIFLPVIALILVIATTSWLEPIIFLICLGFAILFNMGSNLLFGEVSFVTQSMASALQLAISMDYSIFLLHRFAEEKAKGLTPEEAMVRALKMSFSTITASAITTVAGFSALLLMKFKIGTDMGMVFAKGIVFSLLCALFLLPAVTILLSRWLDKTSHRPLIPRMLGLGKLVHRSRYFWIALLLILFVPALLGQQKSDFIYGGSSIAEEEGTATAIAKQKIEERFDAFNPVILLVPKGNVSAEAALQQELSASPNVSVVQSITALADPTLPEELLPGSMLTQFASATTRRMIIGLRSGEEGEETFTTIAWIHERATHHFGSDYHLTGLSAALYDIRSIAARDNGIVTLAGILAVAFVILWTFRSLLLPFLLVLCIEFAVVLNMSTPYFFDQPISFVGMLIVSALMLGATIDYAILYTSRYIERRATMCAKDSMIHAIDDAGGSILTSGIVLAVSGFTIRFTSDVQTVSEMGELIGRGAILSVFASLTVLPSLLLLCDRLIMRRRQGGSQ